MDEQYQTQQEQDNESGMDLCEAWHYEKEKKVAELTEDWLWAKQTSNRVKESLIRCIIAGGSSEKHIRLISAWTIKLSQAYSNQEYKRVLMQEAKGVGQGLRLSGLKHPLKPILCRMLD